MEVLAVTIFCSLMLAVFFVVMFMATQRTRRSVEQEALLPLDDGTPGYTVPAVTSAPHDNSHSL